MKGTAGAAILGRAARGGLLATLVVAILVGCGDGAWNKEVWQTVRDNYLYHDFNGVDWDQVYAEYRAKVEAGISNEQFYLSVDEMIHKMGHEHSDYQTPDEVRTREAEFSNGRNYVGIGVYTVAVPENGLVTVMGVFPGSAAQEAGIQLHDNLLAVDGVSVLDEQGNRRDILRGPEGSTGTFTMQTPGQAPRDITITRRAVSGPIPGSRTLLSTPDGKRVAYQAVRGGTRCTYWKPADGSGPEVPLTPSRHFLKCLGIRE